MVISAVSNTGPVYHLSQIQLVPILDLFSPLAIPPQVEVELKKYSVSCPHFIKIIQMKPKSKDFVNLLVLQFELDAGEAEAIALIRQENAALFLTDDLDAREAAKDLGIEVHGTIGIILRSFREDKISKKVAIEKLYSLRSTTLYVTSQLIEHAVRAIEGYKKETN